MENLRSELLKLQSKTIGIFKPFNELVVDESEHSFITIHLSSLGAFQTNHYPKSDFKFIRIPENYGTLDRLLDEPFEFNKWYELNISPKK